MKSLRITKEERESLSRAVEDAIVSHIEGKLTELTQHEGEARNARLKMFDETKEICDYMTFNEAADIVFKDRTVEQVIAFYTDWLWINKEKDEEPY